MEVYTYMYMNKALFRMGDEVIPASGMPGHLTYGTVSWTFSHMASIENVHKHYFCILFHGILLGASFKGNLLNLYYYYYIDEQWIYIFK